MEPAGEATGARRARHPLVLAVAAVGAVAVAVLLVLVIGGAFADQLSDDGPATVTVTATTEAPPEVVLAPPVSVDNTADTATTAVGG